MTVRSGRLDWLLVEFARDTPGVVHGVVVSGDGLRLATSPGVGTALGDQLAAAASGLISLTILEMTGGYLFVSSVGPGASLAVYAEGQCDIGLVGYEMTMLASRVGHALNPAARTTAGG